MKLNFWQWIGILLLVLGAFLMFKNQFKGKPAPNPTPATQPAA